MQASSQQSLVSIIVPVYNVMNYLNRCVYSILKQTYRNIEVILVDDGSTDGSGDLCDKISDYDKRIIVVHKINGGLSTARNAGIDAAHGEYLCFIDSDDVISPYYIEHLLNHMQKNDADIAIGRYQTFTHEIMFENNTNDNIKVYSGVDAVGLLIGAEYVQYTIACNKVFRRGLFESIRFPVGKLHEDEATMYKLFYISKRVVSTDEIVYGYFMRQGSITKAKFSRKRLDYLDVAKERALFFKEHQEEDFYVNFLYVYAMGLLSYSVQVKKELKDEQLFCQMYQEFKQLRLVLLKAEISIKRKCAILFLGISPECYMLFLKLQAILHA